MNVLLPVDSSRLLNDSSRHEGIVGDFILNSFSANKQNYLPLSLKRRTKQALNMI